MSNSDPDDRREYARIKLRVPVEIRTDSSASPIRGATSDLSLGGCYIESIFPFPIGTNLNLQLSLTETTILIAATVATSDPTGGKWHKLHQDAPRGSGGAQSLPGRRSASVRAVRLHGMRVTTWSHFGWCSGSAIR